MASLDALATALPDPQAEFEPYSDYVNLGSGQRRGMGWAKVRWVFSVLTVAQRDQLRTFCSGVSAAVFIQTAKNDSSDAYTGYSAVMIWPETEVRRAGLRLGLTIEFRILEALG
jgi:hypothetical protein